MVYYRSQFVKDPQNSHALKKRYDVLNVYIIQQTLFLFNKSLFLLVSKAFLHKTAISKGQSQAY